MKTQLESTPVFKRILVLSFALLILGFPFSLKSYSQEKESIAILYFDTQDIQFEPVTLGNLIRIEVEKMQLFTVIDKYDMFDLLAKNNLVIDNCFGKNCLVEAGKILGVDKMLTGSVERLGIKIVFTLRLIDVEKAVIEKSSVMEYIDNQELIPRMARLSLNDLLGIENDKLIVDQLTNIEEPLISISKAMKLNGPRMGVAYLTGEMGDVISRTESRGGYDGYPLLSQFGYQFETQYLSAGEFQALIEFLGVLTGLEQKMFIPNFVVMNGFRLNTSGWEVAFGPSFTLRKSAMGFYDNNTLMGGEKGDWYLDYEWYNLHTEANPYANEIVERMDSRGDVSMSTGWVWAIGKTFRSGYLNIPVNAYISPNKEGWYVGLSVGFNTSRRK